MKKKITIFVDGSYLRNMGRIGVAAIAIVDGQEYKYSLRKRHINFKNKGAMRAEFEAAKLGIRKAIHHGATSIVLCYDFAGIKYHADTLPTGKNKKIPWIPQYHDFMAEAQKSVVIKFKKVKGHSGNKYNNEVDRIAKSVAVVKVK